MTDTIYPHLRKRLSESYVLTPNDLYNPTLTAIFKRVSGKLKSFPFKIIIPISVLSTLILYAVVGFLIVRLVSILQFGF